MDYLLGVAVFVGMIVLLIAIPLALSYLPKGVKDWGLDNFVWLFLAFGILIILLQKT